MSPQHAVFFRTSCADSENYVRGSPTLTTFFQLMGGEMIQIPLKTGHCRLAMAFHWRADDGLTLNAD